MKKLLLITMMALIAAGVFAQTDRETLTVNGKLVLVNGHIAVRTGDTVYFVVGINRLIGFVDGLKEEAVVTLDGYAREFPKFRQIRSGNSAESGASGAVGKVLWVTKLTLGNKSYDLSPAGRPVFFRPGSGQPGFDPGPGFARNGPRGNCHDWDRRDNRGRGQQRWDRQR
jgi:hypothetical protein